MRPEKNGGGICFCPVPHGGDIWMFGWAADKNPAKHAAAVRFQNKFLAEKVFAKQHQTPAARDAATKKFQNVRITEQPGVFNPGQFQSRQKGRRHCAASPPKENVRPRPGNQRGHKGRQKPLGAGVRIFTDDRDARRGARILIHKDKALTKQPLTPFARGCFTKALIQHGDAAFQEGTAFGTDSLIRLGKRFIVDNGRGEQRFLGEWVRHTQAPHTPTNAAARRGDACRKEARQKIFAYDTRFTLKRYTRRGRRK